MNLKLLLTATLFATAPYVAFAQTDKAPKPTLADAQKVVQIISNDESKLQTYCEIGKLEDEMANAKEANDTKTVEALLSKAEALAQQIGPEYIKASRRVGIDRSKVHRSREARCGTQCTR